MKDFRVILLVVFLAWPSYVIGYLCAAVASGFRFGAMNYFKDEESLAVKYSKK